MGVIKRFGLKALSSLKAAFRPGKILYITDSRILHIKLTPSIQFFIVLFVAIITMFITYHTTLYVKSAELLERKDSDIAIANAINENLSIQLYRTIRDIQEIKVYIQEGGRKKIEQQIVSSSAVPAENVSQIVTEGDLIQAKSQMNQELKQLNVALNDRISNIEKAIEISGIGRDYLGKSFKNTLFSTIRSIGKSPSDQYNIASTEESVDVPRSDGISFKRVSMISKNVDGNIEAIKHAAKRVKQLQYIAARIPARMPIYGAKMTSGYGFRMHPKYFLSIFHKGIDFVGKPAAPIFATGDGTVRKAEYSSSYGKYVTIDHGANITTLYAHLGTLKVQSGDKVRAGQYIGNQGNTGHTTGPHLHYEIHYNGSVKNPLHVIKVAKLLQ